MTKKDYRKESDHDPVKRKEVRAIEEEAVLVIVIETEKEGVNDDIDIAEVDQKRESIIEIEIEKTSIDPPGTNQGMSRIEAQDTIEEKKMETKHKTWVNQLQE